MFETSYALVGMVQLAEVKFQCQGQEGRFHGPLIKGEYERDKEKDSLFGLTLSRCGLRLYGAIFISMQTFAKYCQTKPFC